MRYQNYNRHKATKKLFWLNINEKHKTKHILQSIFSFKNSLYIKLKIELNLTT